MAGLGIHRHLGRVAGEGEDAVVGLGLVAFGRFQPAGVDAFGQLFRADVPGIADIGVCISTHLVDLSLR